MSVLKMGVLTFIICLGTAGYAWCNWPSEKMRLNDVKDDDYYGANKFEQCSYCGCISFYGSGCLDPNCPGSK